MATPATNRLGGKPLRPFANPHEKPAADASLFARAAWWLFDYAELWYEMGPIDVGGEDEHRCTEMQELARCLLEMDVAQQRFTAEIVKDIPAIPVFLKG